jgi:hypothetical protein
MFPIEEQKKKKIQLQEIDCGRNPPDKTASTIKFTKDTHMTSWVDWAEYASR